VAKIDVRNLGDYIREQRSIAEISLRQLASQAGVSNPYLSQIERGLRKPSAEILQQIAKALRISAEALYIQAGILEERYGDSDVPAAILSDSHLADRQKQVLLELYEAYRRDAETQQASASTSPPSAAATPKSTTTRTARRAAAPPTSAPSTPPAPSTPRRSDARSA
jgi:transcriptional regulator with XRE-family HTH domain